MDSLDKKLEVIMKNNVDVPVGFENAIKNPLTKEGMVNMKKRIMPKKILIVLMICVVIIAGGIGAYPIAKEYVEYKKY